jgi:hypothetical protein
MSSVGWDVSALLDGEYAMMIQVRCEERASIKSSASVTTSFISKLLLDRREPVEYAQHTRPVGPYYPGDDISIAFNEEISHEDIIVSGKVSDGTRLNQIDLLVSYSDNSVFIDFSPSMSISVCGVCVCVCM